MKIQKKLDYRMWIYLITNRKNKYQIFLGCMWVFFCFVATVICLLLPFRRVTDSLVSPPGSRYCWISLRSLFTEPQWKLATHKAVLSEVPHSVPVRLLSCLMEHKVSVSRSCYQSYDLFITALALICSSGRVSAAGDGEVGFCLWARVTTYWAASHWRTRVSPSRRRVESDVRILLRTERRRLFFRVIGFLMWSASDPSQLQGDRHLVINWSISNSMPRMFVTCKLKMWAPSKYQYL